MTHETAAITRAEPLGGKYLTFEIADEVYGLPIRAVQEIVAMVPITRVPRTPDHVDGVINLRGKIIAITNLRRRFAISGADVPATVIIIVESAGHVVGLAVDKVSEVLQIADGDIEPPPPLGAGAEVAYLRGLAKSDGHVRLLLDIDHVLATEDLRALETLTAA